MFFFFKQKTAYDMRISDWSSYVCSSDLVLALDLVEQCGGEAILLAVEPVLRRAVQRIDVARDVTRVLLDPAAAGAGRQQGGDHEGGGEQARRDAQGGTLSHARGIATARMNARSEEHTSELQSLMRISYAVFCLKKKKQNSQEQISTIQ